MQQYRVDFFDRSLTFVHNTTVEISSIDEDYISNTANSMEIPSTLLVASGQFVRLQSENHSFFGVVSDVSPGDHVTTVRYRSFLTAFDEDILFNTSYQGSGSASHPTLEAVIKLYLEQTYKVPSDSYQRLPISVVIDSSITQTANWSLGIDPENENGTYAIVKLYSDIIVAALKGYGTVIDVMPNFHDKTVRLVITKRSTPFKIAADLDDVLVKTLKYNNKAIGTNKLIVYNNENYTEYVIFYVHTDQSWDYEDRDRITPVIREIRTVAPDSSIEDSSRAFSVAAVDAAYQSLSGAAYDNLIELVTYADDKNISPLTISIGQTVKIWYQGATYTSILTGKVIENRKITLLFGSQRIEYSKRFKLYGGK